MTTSPVPVLQAGDVLTRDEFERRYNAMPELKKAELIEGIVYMMPRVPFWHGRAVANLAGWLGSYQTWTSGLGAGMNCTVRLDWDNEPQPDILLFIPERAGGRSRVDADGFIEGPPELVIEVTASSVSYDLHQKLHVYRRNGVLEYLVHRVDDGEVDWFVLEGSSYVRQQPDAQSVLASRVFPGLRLDVPALLREDLKTLDGAQADLRALHAAVERGCAGAEHAAFVRRLVP